MDRPIPKEGFSRLAVDVDVADMLRRAAERESLTLTELIRRLLQAYGEMSGLWTIEELEADTSPPEVVQRVMKKQAPGAENTGKAPRKSPTHRITKGGHVPQTETRGLRDLSTTPDVEHAPAATEFHPAHQDLLDGYALLASYFELPPEPDEPGALDALLSVARRKSGGGFGAAYALTIAWLEHFLAAGGRDLRVLVARPPEVSVAVEWTPDLVRRALGEVGGEA